MNQKTIYFCGLLLEKLIDLKKEGRVFEDGPDCVLESGLTPIAKLVISQIQKNLNADADNPAINIITYNRNEGLPDSSFPLKVDKLINVAAEFLKIFVAKENK